MATIADVLGQLHITPPAGTDLIFAQIVPGKAPSHAPFSRIADDEVESYDNLYLASGSFVAGTVKGSGRSAENVAAVLTVPFDCDLNDYLGYDKEAIWQWEDDEILAFAYDLQKTVSDAFSALNLPLHRLDYTGYGLCAHIYLRDAQPDDTKAIMQAHKAIIARLNEHVGFRMVDPARSDAGPGLARFPGSKNTKNPEKPRTVTTLIPFSPIAFRITPQQFISLAGTQQRASARPPRPIVTATMTDDLAADIIAAIAPVWTPGRRHMIALGLCGLLAKAGIPADQTADMIATISAGDDEPWDRLTAVKTTYQRIADGQDVAGFTTLQREIGPQQLDYLTTRLDGITRQQQKPHLVIGKTITPLHGREEDLYAPAPKEAFYGWFGAYRDLMAPTTEASDTFHLASALTLVGAMMGRSVYTGHASKRLHGNLFTMLIGKSGTSRKDTAMERAVDLATFANPTSTSIFTTPYVLKTHYGSGEKLVEDLQTNPNILWKGTEATTIFTTMRRTSSTLRDKMIEAYDTPPRIENNVRANASGADNPYLSLLTAIQPQRLSEYLTAEDIVSGFANRVMFFPGSPKAPMANPPSVDSHAAYSLYVRLHDAVKQYGSNRSMSLDPRVMPDADAEARMDAWYLSQTEDDDEDRQSMRARNQTFIRKIALIYAVTDASPVITLDHIEAAIALVEWQWKGVTRMLPSWGAQKESRIEQRIIEVLRLHGPKLKKRDIQQKCRYPSKWTTLDFNRVFEGMEKSGLLDRETEEQHVVYFLAAA